MPVPYGQSDMYGPSIVTWYYWQPYKSWQEAARDLGLNPSEVGEIHHQDMFKLKNDLPSCIDGLHNYCLGPALISKPLEDVRRIEKYTSEQPIFL